jgi:hypothetical protein
LTTPSRRRNWQRWRNRSRMNNLGDQPDLRENRVSIKLGVLQQGPGSRTLTRAWTFWGSPSAGIPTASR